MIARGEGVFLGLRHGISIINEIRLKNLTTHIPLFKVTESLENPHRSIHQLPILTCGNTYREGLVFRQSVAPHPKGWSTVHHSPVLGVLCL